MTPSRLIVKELLETPPDDTKKIKEVVIEPIEELDEEPVGPAPPAKETSSVPTWMLL